MKSNKTFLSFFLSRVYLSRMYQNSMYWNHKKREGISWKNYALISAVWGGRDNVAFWNKALKRRETFKTKDSKLLFIELFFSSSRGNINVRQFALHGQSCLSHSTNVSIKLKQHWLSRRLGIGKANIIYELLLKGPGLAKVDKGSYVNIVRAVGGGLSFTITLFRSFQS
jgi:hypothetical protein